MQCYAHQEMVRMQNNYSLWLNSKLLLGTFQSACEQEKTSWNHNILCKLLVKENDTLEKLCAFNTKMKYNLQSKGLFFLFLTLLYIFKCYDVSYTIVIYNIQNLLTAHNKMSILKSNSHLFFHYYRPRFAQNFKFTNSIFRVSYNYLYHYPCKK